MTHTSRSTLVTLTAALALTLAACSTGGAGADASASASPATSTAAEPSSSPTGLPSPETGEAEETKAPAQDANAAKDPASPTFDRSGFATGTQQSKKYPVYGMDQVVKSRVATHPGYDRVVVEYSGKDPINFNGGYVETPLADGSGLPIRIAGNAYIQLTVAGATYPDTDKVLDGSEILPPNLGGAQVVKGVDVKYPFEGMHQVTIGLDKKRPYRVQVFKDPQRLVIDVLH